MARCGGRDVFSKDRVIEKVASAVTDSMLDRRMLVERISKCSGALHT